MSALRRQRAAQNRHRLVAGENWQDGGFVFTTYKGTAFDGAEVTRIFQRSLADAGMPRMTFHSLRHSCATLLLSQGVPMKIVAEQLGHASTALAADVYSHVTPVLEHDAMHRMDELLDGEG